MKSIKDLESSLAELLSWVERSNDKGYDPYDIWSSNKLILSLQGDKNKLSLPLLVTRYLLNELNLNWPKFARKLFFIKQKKHATFMACMLESHVNLYSINKTKGGLEKIEKYKNWLIKDAIKKDNSISWGTPFSWKSGNTTYQIGTGFNVVTAWTASALFSLHEEFNDQESLTLLHKIYNFYINQLNHDNVANDKICFSYSPLKQDYIHNANLFAAEFLLKYGKLTGHDEAYKMGIKALNYSLDQQLDDGSLPYYGRESEYFSEFNDSYHCSYEIRMLWSIWRLTNIQKVELAANRYIEFYLDAFYVKGKISLNKYKSYPVDMTSQADAMILFSQLGDNYKGHLKEIINFSIANFQSPKGYYKYKMLTRKKNIDIPYIRWIQGWTTLGLTHAQKSLHG